MNKRIKIILPMVCGLLIGSNLMASNVYAAEEEKFDAKAHAIEAQKEIDKNNSEIDEIIKTWKVTMTPEEALEGKELEVEGNNFRSIQGQDRRVGTVGDILVTPIKVFSNTDRLFTGHAAIVDTNSDYTIESYPGDGVQRRTNDWKTRYSKYAATRVKGASSSNYKNAAKYAASKIGYGYAFPVVVSKYDTDRFYCSQIVWRAWMEQGYI